MLSILHRNTPMEGPVATKSSYKIALRHPEGVTHAQTLDAPNLAEAVRLARKEAAEMAGGAPSEWKVFSTEQLTGPIVQRAA